MEWTVLQHPDAQIELSKLPAREQSALRNVMEKLQAIGPNLPFPHCSAVKDADRLWELRPRTGRSRWRAFYRQVTKEEFVVGSIGPEAKVDPREFTRAVRAAEDRINKIER